MKEANEEREKIAIEAENLKNEIQEMDKELESITKCEDTKMHEEVKEEKLEVKEVK